MPPKGALLGGPRPAPAAASKNSKPVWKSCSKRNFGALWTTRTTHSKKNETACSFWVCFWLVLAAPVSKSLSVARLRQELAPNGNLGSKGTESAYLDVSESDRCFAKHSSSTALLFVFVFMFVFVFVSVFIRVCVFAF